LGIGGCTKGEELSTTRIYGKSLTKKSIGGEKIEGRLPEALERFFYFVKERGNGVSGREETRKRSIVQGRNYWKVKKGGIIEKEPLPRGVGGLSKESKEAEEKATWFPKIDRPKVLKLGEVYG